MKNSTIRFALYLLAVAALVAAGCGWWLMQQGAVQAPSLIAPAHAQASSSADSEAIGVDTVTVKTQILSQSIAAVGSLRSENAVILRPEISGRIAEINFQEGGSVTKGQTLITLDSAIARAELAQAQAALSLANSQHRRAQQLSQQGFISSQARDESASQLKVQQAAVALAQAQLEKTVITAPFDGLIGLRQVSVGDYVSPGDELAPLESIDPLNVDFRVPEQFLGQVKVGTGIVLRFDALPDLVRDGVVGAISPLIDVGGRSMLLRAKVPNSDGSLRPGLFARVQLRFGDKDALVVPEAAIAPAGDMNYVYRVEDGIAVKVGVMLGLRRDGMVEITHGLEAGDEVLVSGLQKVSNGAHVQVLNSDHDTEDSIGH